MCCCLLNKLVETEHCKAQPRTGTNQPTEFDWRKFSALRESARILAVSLEGYLPFMVLDLEQSAPDAAAQFRLREVLEDELGLEMRPRSRLVPIRVAALADRRPSRALPRLKHDLGQPVRVERLNALTMLNSRGER